MFLSRWAAALVLAGFSLAAVSAVPPKPPRGEGDKPAATPPAAKPKLQFEVSITQAGKTIKATTAQTAIAKFQAIQKSAARGAAKPGEKPAPAEGEKPAEGAGDFSATITLNGDTKETTDPAEAEKVCKRINEAMTIARKKGEDLATLKIPTEDAPMAEGPGAKPEGKVGPRPPRVKNGDGPPMQNPMNPMNAGGVPPMGGFNGPGGTIPPPMGGNGDGLTKLLGTLPPPLQQLAMAKIRTYQMQHNAFPPPNVVMQIVGEIRQAAMNGQLPMGPQGQPPVPKK